jgi:hypothetical protein
MAAKTYTPVVCICESLTILLLAQPHIQCPPPQAKECLMQAPCLHMCITCACVFVCVFVCVCVCVYVCEYVLAFMGVH